MTQQINLLEPSLLPRREWVTGCRLLVAAVVMGLVLLGQYGYEWYAAGASGSAGVAASDAAAVDGGAEAAEALPARVAEAQARLQNDEALMRALGGLGDLPTANGERLLRLYAALPDSVWLEDVQFTSATGVRIAGGALRASGVAELSAALGVQPGFERLPVRVFELGRTGADEPVSAAPPLTSAALSTSSSGGETPSPRPRYFGFVVSSHDLAATEAAR